MTDERLGHVKRFVNNPAMFEAVFYEIREIFLRPKGKREVLSMAAERLAVELLSEASRDLEQYQERRETLKESGNVGM